MSPTKSIAPGRRRFAANLTFLMNRAGLRNARLARWMGVSRETVGQWRKGKAMPSEDRLAALCIALRCQPADLLHSRADEPDLLRLVEWAKRENIPCKRARDLFALGILSGERRTAFDILVPIDLKAPPDSKTRVTMAKVRPPWVAVFHSNFPRLFEESQIDRGDLADEVGVHSSAIAHWLRGRNYPLSERIPDIAKALGVSVTQLVGEIRT